MNVIRQQLFLSHATRQDKTVSTLSQPCRINHGSMTGDLSDNIVIIKRPYSHVSIYFAKNKFCANVLFMCQFLICYKVVLEFSIPNLDHSS